MASDVNVDIKVDQDLEVAIKANLVEVQDAIMVQTLREVQRLNDSLELAATRGRLGKNFRIVAR